MTPIIQTEFFKPDEPHHRGNCWQTVIACVLDLPLDEVPHFVQDEVDHNMEPAWDWWRCTVNWLKLWGYRLHMVEVMATPDEYILATGPSPRGNGLYHVVIYQNGVMVHDPHPEGTGLISVNFNGYVIRKVEPHEAH